MIAIRGAITVSENTAQSIGRAAVELFEEIVRRNSLCDQHITCVIFSCTSDLTAAYPAPYVRQNGHADLAFMCLKEMEVQDSLPMCIRIMLLSNLPSDTLVRHAYLGGAKVLRPDLE